MGYLLLNPLRRWLENPKRLLGPHVQPGMTVLEPGCAMGFFSLPLARIVGPEGKVLCVDLQEQMLARLQTRARRAGLADRIEAIHCAPDALGLEEWAGRIDLAVALHVVHEVPDQAAFLREVYGLLRPGGRLLIVEPRGHVKPEAFAATLEQAREAGFSVVETEGLRAVLESTHG
jgi:ubiquinone/menaquinone biosynthesis C-methylase UbiE